MTVRQAIDEVLQSMPEDRLRDVLDFARFLATQQERKQWQEFQRMQLARAYGPDEPDYSESDLKRKAAQ